MSKLYISRTETAGNPNDRLSVSAFGLDLSALGTTGGTPGDKSYFSLYLRYEEIDLDSGSVPWTVVENLGLYLSKSSEYSGDHSKQSDFDEIIALGNLGYGLKIKNPTTGLYTIPFDSTHGNSLINRNYVPRESILATYQNGDGSVTPVLQTGVTAKVINHASNELIIDSLSFDKKYEGFIVKNTSIGKFCRIVTYVSDSKVLVDRDISDWIYNHNIVIQKISIPSDGMFLNYLHRSSAYTLTVGNYAKLDFEFSIPNGYNNEFKKQFQINLYGEEIIVLGDPPIRTFSTSVLMQHEYQIPNDQAIKIATNFNSDYGTWSSQFFSISSTVIGAPKKTLPEIGSMNDTFSNSNAYFNTVVSDGGSPARYLLRLDASIAYPNGFHPTMIYIGGHDLPDYATITVRAFKSNPLGNYWTRSTSSQVAYEFTIPCSAKEIKAYNFHPLTKCCFFEIEFSHPCRIGRAILTESLPTSVTNNIQNDFTFGFTDYGTEFVTEGKARNFNRVSYVKNMTFGIQVDLFKDKKLISSIKDLINKGNGNQPFLMFSNPRDPYWLSIYGVLKEYPTFEQEEYSIAYFKFDAEEFE